MLMKSPDIVPSALQFGGHSTEPPERRRRQALQVCLLGDSGRLSERQDALLGRRSHAAAGLVFADLQRTEHAVDVGRFDRVAIRAADARVDHPGVTLAPLRAALFDGAAIT